MAQGGVSPAAALSAGTIFGGMLLAMLGAEAASR
jgi:acyl-CoA hydrolase